MYRKRRKRRVSLRSGAEFSEKITLMPILDGCNMVGGDQRKENKQFGNFSIGFKATKNFLRMLLWTSAMERLLPKRCMNSEGNNIYI